MPLIFMNTLCICCNTVHVMIRMNKSLDLFVKSVLFVNKMQDKRNFYLKILLVYFTNVLQEKETQKLFT